MLLGAAGGVRDPRGGWLERRLPLPERRRRLRAWRRTRPFWGGLLVVLGGAELPLVPLSPLPGPGRRRPADAGRRPARGAADGAGGGRSTDAERPTGGNVAGGGSGVHGVGVLRSADGRLDRRGGAFHRRDLRDAREGEPLRREEGGGHGRRNPGRDGTGRSRCWC
ncbi:DUF6114 domain-containing protein [Streptomyces sp. NPDC058674]|uniref:DUF6114 domain-containing protein n=1 Tax=Streptomyces sp. NPDC058674 TaxID=3346592 RepID=UPI00365B74BB